jgi:hypothetical protein
MSSLINKYTRISLKKLGSSTAVPDQSKKSGTNNQSVAATAGGDEKISIITNPRALTFPIVVGLVKAGWEGLKMLPVPQLTSIWLPFALCVLLGMVIACMNLSEEKPGKGGWALGLVLGLVQCLMLFAAVMGITKIP